ncbi:MAG: IS256 family transposase [Chloroflexi bacterium]|nr:IS256 family transposase [Chloroflexota bacterium]MBN9396904.1 IS256 family transposase [Candidatus Melainabacteria bacterium]OJV90373.1 MAG: IS256 family transposase [Chloroflexi bacterium 54-19]
MDLIQQQLGSAKSMNDFFGKEGILSKVFGHTLEKLLEAELTDHLGYDKYEASGRNSGNSRNGKTSRKIRSSAGETEIAVPRDRNGDFEPKLLKKYAHNTNELEEKILGFYARGLSTRDIQDSLTEMYGMDVSAATISTITDKVLPLVEEWQNRPLASTYAIIYLDAIFIKLRREGKVENVAVYNALGVDLEGRRDILDHWIGEGAGEGSKFWLSILGELKVRGVREIFIACVDGLVGFSEAIAAVFPYTEVQRCIIHQIRASLRYVVSKDQKPFMADLKLVYKAATREEAEANLLALGEKWDKKYAVAVRSWVSSWAELSTYFDYTPEIRRLIYTTNSVEGYHRQLRKVIKTKGAFPTKEATKKLMYLAYRNITADWSAPMQNWASILNQLAIKFEPRMRF